jgi:hypothetical protein
MVLVAVTGGHWVTLQTAAWVGMTIDYSQTAPLLVALKKTFDGQHPCKLCCFINKEKKAEPKKSCLKSELRLDWFLWAGSDPLIAPAFSQISFPQEQLLSRSDQPLLRPPRTLCSSA